MTYPNTLVFVDYPTDDVNAARAFYAEVFNWEVEDRIADTFARIVPGQNFKLDDGTQGPTGNLHMGIYNAANARPHPDTAGVEPREASGGGRTARTWILVGDEDSQDRILDTAVRLGATVLWRNHYWAEFNGNNGAFTDPWGNTFILWSKPGDNPTEQEGFTHE